MTEISFRDFKIVLLETNQWEAFYQLIENNRQRLKTFFAGTVAKTKSLDVAKQYGAQMEKDISGKHYFPFIILDKVTNEFIGLIDVKNINWSIPKAELGYFIDHKYEGQGIISEGLGLLINYLVKTYHFKKLLCRVNSSNHGSISVALKNGFILEGTVRRDYKTTDGELIDLSYYGRIF